MRLVKDNHVAFQGYAQGVPVDRTQGELREDHEVIQAGGTVRAGMIYQG